MVMPKILPTYKGWRVVIFTNDHRPPHVHVLGANVHARFELLCDLGKLRLLSNIAFTLKDIKQIETYLLKHLTKVCAECGRIHGH
jgi:Domain of unknown function (DUF4160)